MNIQTRAAQATKNRRGVMMAPLLVAVTVAAIVVIPIVRWCMAFINGTENINAQLEMKSIIQDYYARISAASYEDMQETIAANGTTWTEDVGGRYTLKVETSEAGKFENALCNLDETAGAYDQACMKADITLVSNADPSRTVGMQVTRIATPNPLAELADLIEAEGEKFANYYTKTEADAQYACPWDYHLVSGKCVPCPAPSNWKQYRSWNCTLATCSTGYKANSAKTGCTKITCPSGEILNGDICEPECHPEPNKQINQQIKNLETAYEEEENKSRPNQERLTLLRTQIKTYKSQRTEIAVGCQIIKCAQGSFPNESENACVALGEVFLATQEGASCPGSGCIQRGCPCGGLDYYFVNGNLVLIQGYYGIGTWASSDVSNLNCTGVGDLNTMSPNILVMNECATTNAYLLARTCAHLPKVDLPSGVLRAPSNTPYPGASLKRCGYQ